MVVVVTTKSIFAAPPTITVSEGSSVVSLVGASMKVTGCPAFAVLPTGRLIVGSPVIAAPESARGSVITAVVAEDVVSVTATAILVASAPSLSSDGDTLSRLPSLSLSCSDAAVYGEPTEGAVDSRCRRNDGWGRNDRWGEDGGWWMG
jgi:hypothetical protein